MKRCETCTKRRRKGGEFICAVLTHMIGLAKDCFAYSDDPLWEEKVKIEVQEYHKIKKGD